MKNYSYLSSVPKAVRGNDKSDLEQKVMVDILKNIKTYQKSFVRQMELKVIWTSLPKYLVFIQIYDYNFLLCTSITIQQSHVSLQQ